MPSSQSDAQPTPKVLICLGPCRGEFYLPLDWDEAPVCPNDRKHDVAVYGDLIVRHYCDSCGTELGLWQAGRVLCVDCEKDVHEQNRDLADFDV